MFLPEARSGRVRSPAVKNNHIIDESRRFLSTWRQRQEVLQGAGITVISRQAIVGMSAPLITEKKKKRQIWPFDLRHSNFPHWNHHQSRRATLSVFTVVGREPEPLLKHVF